MLLLRGMRWNDPRVVLGCVHLLCICTIIATLTTFFSVGHTVREGLLVLNQLLKTCELIKESDLYKSFKVDKKKICINRLPTISYTGILLPEQCIFAVGLSLAGLGGLRAHYLIGKTQLDVVEKTSAARQRKEEEEEEEEGDQTGDSLGSYQTWIPPLFLFFRRKPKDDEDTPRKLKRKDLAAFCRTTIRVGQVSCFWILPTACVSMKHNIAVHGLSAFFFFGLACTHVVCSYIIQYNFIAQKIVVNKQFEASFKVKELVLRCAVLLVAVGSIVYLSLRFTSMQIYLYTLGGALGQYSTVLWLTVGYSTYYVDLTVLLSLLEEEEKKNAKEDERQTISLV